MKEESRREKKDRILEKAGSLFLQKGIETTKIIDIARASGVAKGTVYEYFGSKEEIVADWIQQMFQEFREQQQKKIAAEKTMQGKLNCFFDHTFEQIEKVTVVAKIIMERNNERHHIPPLPISEEAFEKASENRIAIVVMDNVRNEIELIQEILRDGRAHGEVRSDIDLRFLSYAILSMMPFMGMLKQKPTADSVREHLRNQIGIDQTGWSSNDLCRLLLTGIKG